MKKGRLAPYILVSFLIHTGFLIGAHQFLKLPAEELEPADLIPVEVVVLREESPALQPELAPGDRIWPKKALQTKSQIMMETATDRSADDMATPIPKAGGFEPNVMMAGMATTGFIAEALAGESADSKPVVPASQLLRSQISPVAPSAPIETALLEVQMPAVLVEAKAKLTPADSQTPQKIETPLASRRPREDLAAEHQPIPREGTYEPVLMVSTLQVQSRPNGAQVYVNGMLTGETPLDMELLIGIYEVRLALPDYYDWEAQIELTERNKAQSIIFRLLPVE